MGHFFKTRKQREREERQQRRRAFRQAENALEDTKERLQSLDREARKQWESAVRAEQAGEKEASRRYLVGYRAAQVLATKYEQKRWVFEQYLLKMESMRTDQEFADAMEAINKVTQVDPESTMDVFESSQELLGEQMDTERFWNRLYEKETGGASRDLEAHLPTMEDLTRQVQEEASLESGHGTAAAQDALEERRQAIQEKVRRTLDARRDTPGK